ncbi:hypothetical protein [Paenibacillus endoradicis]|uniref:hypothetical protein n=1 Tax=Paenibacillus endoradicis TaxID=2972487 RepID=UPI0021593196|nr:hypothetical protein [Paenibacillus endoradicis]MCR8655789.1 hypothetical protein [Paenibacillus endoradicis]MCR8658115.1 hypothetical protein [Paenibacillus endoradicis]
MAGNIYYIIYSIGLVIAFCIVLIIIKSINRKRIIIVFLTVSIPIFILCQTYFWNFTFNSYVKSYLLSSESFSCEFEEDLKNITIPLPKRTVFQAKEDVCSPFYITYVGENEFQSFYEKELTRLKTSGQIQNYYFIQEGVRAQKDRSRYFVELSSGPDLVISFQTSDDTYWLAITYVPDN